MIRNFFGFFNIEGLPADDLEKLSENLTILARHINFIAARKRRQSAPRQDRYKVHERRVFAACKYIYERFEKSNLEKEITKASRKFDVSEKVIITILPIYKSRHLQIKKIERDRDILRYYRLGYNNRETANKIGVHEKTVAKIRRRLLSEIIKPLKYPNIANAFAA